MKNISARTVTVIMLVAAPLMAAAQTTDLLQAQMLELYNYFSGEPRSGPSYVSEDTYTISGRLRFEPSWCAIDNTLSNGARGSDVAALQEFLGGMEYLRIKPTSYFGVMTEKALSAWQKDEGIPPTGVFGPISRARMQKGWCGKSPQTPPKGPPAGGGTGKTGSGPAVCPMVYMPVCGEHQVQCIKAPCRPVQKTYGNRCQLDAGGARFLYQGECRG